MVEETVFVSAKTLIILWFFLSLIALIILLISRWLNMKETQYYQHLIKIELDTDEQLAVMNFRNGIKSWLMCGIFEYLRRHDFKIVDFYEEYSKNIEWFWEAKIYTDGGDEIKVGYRDKDVWIHVSTTDKTLEVGKVANEILEILKDIIIKEKSKRVVKKK